MKRTLVLTGLAATLAGPAFGGPIYMQYEGIPGEASAPGHDKWIEVSSIQWGVALPAPPPAPAPAGVAVGGPGTVSLAKRTDKSSPLLSKAAATGKLVPAVRIDVPKPTSQNPNAYLSYELKNVMISSFRAAGAGGAGAPTESLSLNFTKIEFQYAEQKASQSGAPAPASYSLTGAPKTPTPSKGATTQAPATRR